MTDRRKEDRMDEALTPTEERELAAVEAGAAGLPVEADLADLARLGLDLSAARPAPGPEYAAGLDRAVLDRFPPEWAEEMPRAGERAARGGRPPVGAGSWLDRLRRRLGTGRRIALPAAAGLAGLLIVATGAVAVLDSDRLGDDPAEELSRGSAASQDAGAVGDVAESVGAAASKDAESPASQSEALDETDDRYVRAGRSLDGTAVGRMSKSDRTMVANADRPAGRKVAVDASLTLGTDPDGVQGVANDVVEVVDEHRGIVLDSSVTDGPEGRAGAEFSLSIPSRQVESAIADLSGIADLRERNQQTEDITAPFTTTADRLKTTRARIAGLLGELESAYTDEDRQRIERRLRAERWRARDLQRRMNRLEKRVAMTPVAVSVVTDRGGSGSSWGLGEALDDAGRLLGIAAGVALIALAISIPIGLMALIVLAINRAWVRRARNRALNGD